MLSLSTRRKRKKKSESNQTPIFATVRRELEYQLRDAWKFATRNRTQPIRTVFGFRFEMNLRPGQCLDFVDRSFQEHLDKCCIFCRPVFQPCSRGFQATQLASSPQPPQSFLDIQLSESTPAGAPQVLRGGNHWTTEAG
jgi:hypothetical protein